LRHPLIAHSELERLEAAGSRTNSTEVPARDPLLLKGDFAYSTAPQRTPNTQNILPDHCWTKNVPIKKYGESRAAKESNEITHPRPSWREPNIPCLKEDGCPKWSYFGGAS
jgi:hypothetical protein